MNPRTRAGWAMSLGLCCATAAAAAAEPGSSGGYAPVVPGRALEFPRDFGSHPDFRTEWWYVTGWLTTASGTSLGFQITFFRSKPSVGDSNPSAFAPRQLLVAHCAISDPQHARLWQDQRIRRAGFGLAEASTADTDVFIDDWWLRRRSGTYFAQIAAEDFGFTLELSETEPRLLNGAAGVSRKGPEPQAASYYYSLPHLTVAGRIERNGTADRVIGEAWFDHEWSSVYLAPGAVGWDWLGINLEDGGALMLFRIRGAHGAAHWAGGTLRDAGRVTELGPQDVTFTPLRTWTSPRTAIVYPVAWTVRAGARELVIEPLMEDQENDTRLSTGAIYWEGAVRAFEQRRPVGRGYLELTGYGEPLQLR